MLELFIVIAIILILLAIELPNLWRTQMAARQAAAQVSLREIQTAEVTYASTYGHGYSTSLAKLGPPPPNTPGSAQAAGMLDSLLAKGRKGAYQFIYIPGPLIDGKVRAYTLKAVPSQPCVSASAFYSLDANGATTAGTFVSSLQPETPAEVVARVLGGNAEANLLNCGVGGP
jgi:type II secretory pathway pseudopilin PulG